MAAPINFTNLTGDPWDSVDTKYVISVPSGPGHYFLDAREIWNGIKLLHESTSRPLNPYTREPLTCDLLMKVLDVIDLMDRNNYLLAECLETLCLIHPRVFIEYTRKLLDMCVCTRLTHTSIERLVELDKDMAIQYVHLADYESAWLGDIHMLGGYATVVNMLQSETPFGLSTTCLGSVQRMLQLNNLPYSRAATDFIVSKAVFSHVPQCLLCMNFAMPPAAAAAQEASDEDSSNDEPMSTDLAQFARELIQLGLVDMAVDDDSAVEKVEAYLQEKQFTNETFVNAFEAYVDLRNPIPIWLLNRSLGVPHPVLKAMNRVFAEQLLAANSDSVSYVSEAFVFATTHMARIPFMIETYANLAHEEQGNPAVVTSMVRDILKK